MLLRSLLVLALKNSRSYFSALSPEGIRLCILHSCLEELEIYRHLTSDKIGKPVRLNGFIKKNVIPHVHPPGLWVFQRGKEEILWVTHGLHLKAPIMLC